MLPPGAVLVVPAAALAWLLLAGLIPFLRRRLLDQPNARSSHSRPTPRGGGVVFVTVAVLAWVLLGSWALLWTLPLALVGLIDDWRSLPAGLRYGTQVLTAVLLLSSAALPGVTTSFWLAAVVVVAATALINAINFMDGIDGLVAGCMAVLFGAAATAGHGQLWPLVGALLGFLAWNWSPAGVFMGDAGSTFLGAVLVAVLLDCSSWQQVIGLLLVAMPLLADAGTCLLRRSLAGQPVFQAHRLHLYQRLHQAGWPHGRISLLYVLATAFQAVVVGFGGWPMGVLGALLLAVIGVLLDTRQAVPFRHPS